MKKFLQKFLSFALRNKISIEVSDFSVTQVLKQLATRHLWYYNQTPYDYNAKLCTIRPISYKSDIIAS